MTEMDANAGFRASLEEARNRLADETRLRDESIRATAQHDAEIVRLRRVVVSLAAMVGEPAEMESIGITEACRAVMLTTLVPLKLRNVRDLLADVGFDPRSQNNLDASVQAVLARLVEKREIARDEVNAPGGKKVVVYIGPKVSKAQRAETFRLISSGNG